MTFGGGTSHRLHLHPNISMEMPLMKPWKLSARQEIPAREGAWPHSLEEYEFAPRTVVFSPDDSCVARLTSPTSVAISSIDNGSGKSRSPTTVLRPSCIFSHAGQQPFKVNNVFRFSGTHQTMIDLSSTRVVVTTEPISAMEFGPEQNINSFCRRYSVEQQKYAPFVLATGHRNGTIRIWDARSTQIITTLMSHKARITGIVFSPTELRIISVAEDCDMKVREGKGRQGYPVLKRLYVRVASPDAIDNFKYSLGPRLLTGNPWLFQVWDGESNGYNMSVTASHSQALWCCDHSPSGKFVAVAGTCRSVFIYLSGTKTLHLKLRGHMSNVVSCKFTPDDAVLLTASWDTRVHMWDTQGGNLLQTVFHVLPEPRVVFSPYIRSMSISQFGTAVCTLTTDGRIFVWDPANCQESQDNCQAFRKAAGNLAVNLGPVVEDNLADDDFVACAFFRRSSTMALADTNGRTRTYSVSMPTPSLKYLCRVRIRKTLARVCWNPVAAINSMSDLPKCIRSYLLYESW